ncbi:MAG TPA: hypothetical protein VL523_14980 [Terriglobia bacterium]|nr:hypothetical protein [Terriglobia bacterium]
MAGVAPWSGPRGQFGLITHLRWRIFVNSLRTCRGEFDVVSRALVGTSLGVMAFGVGVILAVGGWATFRTEQPLILAAELWFILVFWQLLPVFITGFGAQASLGSLLRFPVRYSAFVLLNLTYGLSDPVALAGTYWLLAILIGVTAAEPKAFGVAGVTILVFAAFNVVLNRALLAWLERWLARRRTRETMSLVFIFFVLSLQLVGPLGQRWGSRALPALHVAEAVGDALPPGLAAGAIRLASRGASGEAWVPLGALAACGAVLAWLLGVRLRAQYRGENLSEARGEKLTQGRAAVHPGWRLVGLSPTVAALFEKDLRYLARNSSVYLTLVVPLLLVFVFGLSGGGAIARGLVVPGVGGAIFPAAVAYCLVILFGLAYNCLGYDGTGLAMLFAAPLRFRDVLFAKNLLHALLVCVEVVAVYVLICFAFSPPKLLVTVLTLCWMLFSLPANFAAANLASVYFPKQLVFGALRRQKAPAVALVIAFVLQILVCVLGGTVYLLGYSAGNPWFAAVGLLALAGITLVIYSRILEACGRTAESRREALMGELCRHSP